MSAGAERARAVALGAAAAVSGMALLAASGWLVTRAAEEPPVLALLAAIVVVRALGLVRAFGRYGERLATHDAAFRRLAALRVRWYRRLIARPPAEDGSAPGAADLLSRFVTDVDELQHREARVLVPALVAAAASLAATVLAAAILPAAGLVLGGGLLLAGTLVPGVALLAARRALRRQGAARAELAVELAEALDAAPQLALAGRGPERLARLDRASEELTRIGRRDAAGAALAQGLGALVAGATLVAVLAVAAGPAADGDLAPVWLGALALLALGAFEPAGALPEAAARAVSVAAAERRLRDAAPAPAAVRGSGAPAATTPHSATPPHGPPPRAAASTPAAVRGSGAPAATTPHSATPPHGLAARGVRHRPGGPGAPLVLDGVDLSLRPGEHVAVVGPSGAGKTVLATLLAGLATPDAGAVTLDGTPLAAIDAAAVRRQVRLSGQDAHLFATSIANNVRVGDPGADDAQVERALRAAGLGGWLDALPDGAATLVGEHGVAVSGGQRQRIALARSLVSPARMLLLDEPTAMLDAATAHALLRTLHAATPGRGVLLITHERDGLEAFDAVLELRDGRLRAAAPAPG